MSEKKEEVSGDREAKTTDAVSQNATEDSPPAATVDAQKEKQQNGSLDGREHPLDTRQQHPQETRPQHPQGRAMRTTMPGLPPINLNQLANILRDPNMPSHQIMNEVADRILQQCKENESDDSSLSSTRGVVGMQGVLETIIEVSIQRPDSDNSDDDETFQRISREIPCGICNKIFVSTMKWKTHVLVAHQDPSVLNLRRISTSEVEKKEKSNRYHRKHSRNPPRPDTGGTDNKTRHTSKTDGKQIAGAYGREENVPENKRQSSIVRPLPTAKSVSSFVKQTSDIQKLQAETETNCKTSSCESKQEHTDLQINTNEVKDNINCMVNAESLQIQESASRNIGSAEDKEINLPTEVHSESMTFTQGPNINPSSPKIMEGEQKEHSRMSNKPATTDTTSGDGSIGRKKRKATSPTQESSSPSTSEASSSHSKRSRKHIVEEPGSSSTPKLE